MIGRRDWSSLPLCHSRIEDRISAVRRVACVANEAKPVSGGYKHFEVPQVASRPERHDTSRVRASVGTRKRREASKAVSFPLATVYSSDQRLHETSRTEETSRPLGLPTSSCWTRPVCTRRIYITPSLLCRCAASFDCCSLLEGDGRYFGWLEQLV